MKEGGVEKKKKTVKGNALRVSLRCSRVSLCDSGSVCHCQIVCLLRGSLAVTGGSRTIRRF